MEPVTTLTAITIAGLAFNEFIKSGAGEIAKKSVGSAINLVKNLRDQIRTKFQGNERAERALSEVEQQGEQSALEKVTKYLDIEMTEDEAFATQVRQIAQQIINIQNKNTEGDRTYNQTAGRDIFHFEKIDGGSHKFGGT